jgi:uncharacterized metal-binding protein
MMTAEEKPIVYSCSGCSSAAQMANYLAVQLDRLGIAEMSCIAGLGGDVKKMVKTAKQATKIIAIDGCPLSCAKATLKRHGLEAREYYQLGDMGIKKLQHADFDRAQADLIFDLVVSDLNTQEDRHSE